ncbi:hypothetical protein [Pseudactinotalea sp. HY158]|uniref:hypothetical protein n=1 Tax=Pseudactinotalea sp. HY158 TaxID=2654547 RepID=UPI00129CBC9C|nr:hypothetical protein [Pseudactinotalea sp. HY158]QGH70586.1 hypothetical protein GCE65_14620 [Pseudactinotalea sp. HY158]
MRPKPRIDRASGERSAPRTDEDGLVWDWSVVIDAGDVWQPRIVRAGDAVTGAGLTAREPGPLLRLLEDIAAVAMNAGGFVHARVHTPAGMDAFTITPWGQVLPASADLAAANLGGVPLLAPPPGHLELGERAGRELVAYEPPAALSLRRVLRAALLGAFACAATALGAVGAAFMALADAGPRPGRAGRHAHPRAAQPRRGAVSPEAARVAAAANQGGTRPAAPDAPASAVTMD